MEGAQLARDDVLLGSGRAAFNAHSPPSLVSPSPSPPSPPPNATSEKKLEDEGINAILAQSTDAKKKKKANKKKKKAGGGEGGEGDGETKEGGE